MAMSDLHVVEETIHLLDEEKMQLIAELEHARDLFVQRESEFMEQAQELAILQSQMEEVNLEKARVAQL